MVDSLRGTEEEPMFIEDRIKQFSMRHNIIGYYQEQEWRKNLLQQIKESVYGKAYPTFR